MTAVQTRFPRRPRATPISAAPVGESSAEAIAAASRAPTSHGIGFPDFREETITGRAYFGDHLTEERIGETQSHPLYRHIKRLNQIRRAMPALQKGGCTTCTNGAAA